MKFYCTLAFLCTAILAYSGNISLDGWKISGKKDCGTAVSEKGRLVINAKSGQWRA